MKKSEILEKNREAESLTYEQCGVLDWLCEVCRNIRGNDISDFFRTEANPRDGQYFWDEGDGINTKLKSVGLPSINFGSYIGDVMTEEDYYYTLFDDERKAYENKAEKLNNEGRHIFEATGLTVFYEEEGAESITNTLTAFNNKIFDYLVKIDEEHGTEFASCAK